MKAHVATIEAILIADNPETFVTRRIPETKLEFGGIPGDRHFGVTFGADSRQTMYPRGTEILNRRQITVVSQEDCDIIAEKLGIPTVLPEWLGANLLISGFPDLTSLTMGSRLYCQVEQGLSAWVKICRVSIREKKSKKIMMNSCTRNWQDGS